MAATTEAPSDYRRTFNRFELKYVVKVDDIDGIVEALQPYVAPDEHGDHLGGYDNFTVYCDSPDLRYFWEKVEGVKFRRKVRFRRYGNQEDVFLEIKQRIGRTVQKRRVRWPLQALREVFLTGAGLREEFVPDPDDPVCREILLLWRSHNLRPTMTTWYMRRALAGLTDPGLRVTFDTAVKYSAEALDPTQPWPGGELMMDPRVSIMELKFNDRAPRWLASLIGDLGLRGMRVSKYCRGVDLARFGGKNT